MDGEQAVEGLLVRTTGKETGLEGNVYERRGYSVGIQEAPLRRYKDCSTDSTEFEEVEPVFPAWSKWAGLGEKMGLGILQWLGMQGLMRHPQGWEQSKASVYTSSGY